MVRLYLINTCQESNEYHKLLKGLKGFVSK